MNSISLIRKAKKNLQSDRPRSLLRNKPWLVFFSLSLVLSPFYLWRSGIPQIADFLLLLSMVVYMMHIRGRFSIPTSAWKFVWFGFFFIAYIFVINIYWSIKLNSTAFYLPTFYYIYNYLVAIYVIILCHEYKKDFLELIYKSSVVSILLQIILFAVEGGFNGRRMVLSFNNPNQLARYVILVISLLLFASRYTIQSRKWFIACVTAGFVFVLSSLSKAGIIAYLFMIILYFVNKGSNKNLKNRLVFLIIVLLIVVIFSFNNAAILQNIPLFGTSYNRIMSIGSQEDDSLIGRGYNRILEHSEYWVFGAGEGEFARLDGRTSEFHSTLGTVQLAYGLIGTILFAAIMVFALKRDHYKAWPLLFGIMLYGLTHNGIRDSMFWILLALMIVADESNRRSILII